MTAQEKKTVSAFILEKTGVNKMNENKWFVANDNGDIIGHDMGEAKAKALEAEMQEKEPDAGWEAMNGDYCFDGMNTEEAHREIKKNFDDFQTR